MKMVISPFTEEPTLKKGGLSLFSALEEPTEKMTPRERDMQEQMICLLIANGESVDSTAAKLNLGRTRVDSVIKTPKCMEMIVRFQHDIAPEPRQRIKKMASIALDVQTRLLLGPTADAVKAKVAQEIIDRDLGKATQVIESRSMHFDLTDALQIDQALLASQEKLKRIEEMQKKLALPVGRTDECRRAQPAVDLGARDVKAA